MSDFMKSLQFGYLKNKEKDNFFVSDDDDDDDFNFKVTNLFFLQFLFLLLFFR